MSVSQEWIDRRRADPLRSRRREHRPDPTPEELSDDPFVAAWQRWDARPSEADRVDDLLALCAVEAAALGIPSFRLWDRLVAARRAGLSRDAAIAETRGLA